MDKKIYNMYWVAPLTSRIAKFDKIVVKKQAQGKPTDISFKTQVRLYFVCGYVPCKC